MDHSNDGAEAELYLLRIWKGRPRDAAHLLHGRLQHVLSGEARTFHDRPTLIDLLELAETESIHRTEARAADGRGKEASSG